MLACDPFSTVVVVDPDPFSQDHRALSLREGFHCLAAASRSRAQHLIWREFLGKRLAPSTHLYGQQQLRRDGHFAGKVRWHLMPSDAV